MSLVRFGRGPEKNGKSDIVLAKLHTDATLILVTSDWCNWVITADVNNYFAVFMLILSQQF